MFPPSTAAASLVPSLDIVMLDQACVLPVGLTWAQLSPESVDVQTFPSWTVAASLVPSLDDVISCHFCGLALDVHVSPKSSDVQMFPK